MKNTRHNSEEFPSWEEKAVYDPKGGSLRRRVLSADQNQGCSANPRVTNW